MASPYIWGNLNRAVNDPTLIDEAIGQAIEAHESNPDAHLGADESLESHRASEIIDHRAESVVNDKLALRARRWAAIVDPTTGYDFDTIEAAVDYVGMKMPGDILVKSGVHYVDKTISLPATTSLCGEGIGETVIMYSGTDDTAIDVATSLSWFGGTLNSVSWSSGTTTINFSSSSVPVNESLIGRSLEIYSGGSYTVRRIVEIMSPTSVRVSGANLTSGSALNMQIGWYASAQSGLDTVTLGTAAGLSTKNIQIGYTLIINSGGAARTTIGVIDSIDDAGVITLRESYSGVNKEGFIECVLENVPYLTMSDFTLSGNGVPAGIATYDEGCRGLFERIHIKGFVNPLYWIGATDMSKSEVRSSSFDYSYNTSILIAYNTVFNNCEFKRLVNNTNRMLDGGNNTFRDCLFTTTGAASILPFPSAFQDITFDNCDFYGVRSFQLVGDSSGGGYKGITISNSKFVMNASQTMGLAGRGSRFQDNIIRGTTSAFTLATGSQLNVVTGNISDGAFTNSGTNNIFANNQTY